MTAALQTVTTFWYHRCVAGESSDFELATRVTAGGDQGRAAERAICERFAARVRLFGCRHLRDPADVDDLVQDVLLHVLGALRSGRVEEPQHLGSYVLGVSHNKVREARRRTSRVAPEPPPEASQLPALPEVRLGRLEDCMSTLAARERTVLRMTFCEGARAPIIGEVLGMSADHVRVARQRALRTLRGCLENPKIVIAR